MKIKVKDEFREFKSKKDFMFEKGSSIADKVKFDQLKEEQVVRDISKDIDMKKETQVQMISNLNQEKEWIQPSKKPPVAPPRSTYQLPTDDDKAITSVYPSSQSKPQMSFQTPKIEKPPLIPPKIPIMIKKPTEPLKLP